MPERRRRFGERQIVDIAWINAIEHYHNALALPLGIGSDRLAAGRDGAQLSVGASE